MIFDAQGLVSLGRWLINQRYDFSAITALASKMCAAQLGRVVDVGAGSGAGGMSVAPYASEVVLCDISDAALRAARTNRALNPRPSVSITHSNVLAGITGRIDTVIANPPFLADAKQRTYRDGGGIMGTGLAVMIVEQAIARLHAGGRLLLYTGAPIIGGEDVLARELKRFEPQVKAWRYVETDPDIFGEELDEPLYSQVERIAAVTLTFTT